MLLTNFIINLTLLSKRFEKAAESLKGTTLILHDGSDLITLAGLANILASSRPTIVCSIDKMPHPENPRKAKNLVLMGINISAITDHLRQWKMWSARKPILVISNSKETVKPWIETLWRRVRAIYVTVMVMTDPPKYQTWFPYTPGECTDVVTIIDLNENDIFQKKVPSNLNKCPIKATFNKLIPMVVDNTTGLEPQIFHDLIAKLNATAVFKSLPNHQFVWLTQDLSGEPTNGVKYLWENEVDLVFSNMYMSYNIYTFVDFLTSYIEDNMCFFVPSALPAPRATSLYRMFGAWIWFLIFIVLLSIYIVSLAIFYFTSGQFNPAFSFSIALNLNLPFPKPRIKSLQILAVFVYLYSHTITTWYQSSLILFLREIPREASIQSIEELIDSGMKIIYHPSQMRTLRAFRDPTVQKLINNAIFTEALSLSGVVNHENALLGPKISYSMISSSNSSYYDENGFPLVSIIKKPLYAPRLCFYTSKGHPLYDLLNKYIEWIKEAGLPEQYINAMKVQKPSIIWKAREIKSFSVENFEGAFYILIFFLLLSFAVFVFEIFVKFCFLMCEY